MVTGTEDTTVTPKGRANLKNPEVGIDWRGLVFGLLIVIVIFVAVLAFEGQQSSTGTFSPAPDFRATTVENQTFNLSNFNGSVVVLHFTNIENPICFECEKELKAQTEELETLKEKEENLTIITINMRKNSGSEDGKTLAREWWDVNVTWLWVEEFDPFSISAKYIDYWNLKGGSANPTILLIDPEQQIVGVYHVYQMGKGEVDGIQTDDRLLNNTRKIQNGEWEKFEGEVTEYDLSFIGMFALGILTSFSPCSVVLLITMFSFIMAESEENEGIARNRPQGGEGMFIGVGFTLGMALAFFVVGLFLSSLGSLVEASPYFYLLAGVLLILLGINNIKPIRETLEPLVDVLHRTSDQNVVKPREDRRSLTERFAGFSKRLIEHSAFLGGMVLGLFFGLAWSPCAISLVLPVLIWMISQDMSLMKGALMLFVFGLGHGVPVIPIAVASKTGKGKIGQKYATLGKYTTKAFGVAVIVFGVVFAGRYFGFYLW